MNSRQLIQLICSSMALMAMSACGNKGDLYLPDDPTIRQGMEQIQRVLDIDEVPVADPVEVDDDDIYVKPDRKTATQP